MSFGNQKLTRTRVAYSRSIGRRCRIMGTSKKSTGETLFDLTSYAGDTHVNLSVRLANGEVKKIRVTYGPGYEKPLATYDPDTQSWRMYEDILLWEEPRSLANLPPSGMTRSGVLFPQPPWEPLTDAIGSSSWPTPRANTAMAATITPESAWDEKRFPNLETVVGRRMWPTPTANDAKNPYARVREFSQAVMLGESVLNHDPSTAGGKLNPMWVEWLMGFPLGWTDLED